MTRVTVAIRPVTWENETSRRGAGNTATALTHPSDLSGRRAAVKATQTCTIVDCQKPHKGRGWCETHYVRWKRTGTTADPAKRPTKRPDRRPVGQCSVAGCEGPKPIQARGMCATHYSRWKRTGDPNALRQHRRPDGCAVDDCDQPNYCRDWCLVHYNRWLDHGTTDDPRPSICAAPGCETGALNGDHCYRHRHLLAKYGQLCPPERDRHGHSSGYIMVKIQGHPLAQPSSGWVYEHRAVLLEKIGPGSHPCHWCGTEVTWDLSYPEHLNALVVDHLDDICDNNDPSNLVPSCNPCNFARGVTRRWQREGAA